MTSTILPNSQESYNYLYLQSERLHQIKTNTRTESVPHSNARSQVNSNLKPIIPNTAFKNTRKKTQLRDSHKLERVK